MDEMVAKLKTVPECEQLEKNALKHGRTDLAVDARRRTLEIRASRHGGMSDPELECIKAVYAYEKILSDRRGKKTSASRTWQMIKRHGVLAAVERAVNRSDETTGYTALVEQGLKDYAFEAVILRYPHLFSPEAVTRSKARMG